MEKLKASHVFGIQLDETTDIGGEAQLIVYTRFIEEFDRFLFCLTVGIETTAQAIFDRLDSFMCGEGIEWIKCKAVTTDGAATMVGSCKWCSKEDPDCMSHLSVAQFTASFIVRCWQRRS